ncbi:MAG: ATP-dependent helicase, partial [Armatimonadetes bacterium CG07_land_8_20_14_0_80_40_9]
ALVFLLPLPPDNGQLPAEILFGQDIRYWSSVARFTLELLARQRFIPSIKSTNNEIKAIWKPVINHPNDLERLRILTDSIPAVCCLFVGAQGFGPLDPDKIVTDFIATALDELIHQWLIEKYPQERFIDKGDIISVFLEGLTSSSPLITTTKHNLRVLKESIALWEEKVQIRPQRRTFRTCLRLGEPEEEKGRSDWHLSFHLQAADDKSLIVPAEHIWKETTSTLKYLNHKLGKPQEEFLQDLAQASRLFTPIKESLKDKQPIGCPLTTQQAYIFLKEAALLLDESGYGVLVPSWWERKRQLAQLGVKLSIKPPTTAVKSYFTLNSLVEFNWQTAIGDEILTEEEFEKLSQLKQPLVRIRGKWVEVQPDQLQATLKFWTEVKEKGLTLAQALQVGTTGQSTGLPIIEFTPEGWLNDLVNYKFKRLPQPKQFNGELRKYQIYGFSWLAFLRKVGLGACLADDMGLGKTIQLIALLLDDKARQKKKTKPTLLICPTSVVGNWKKELERFSPSLKVMVHHGQERLAGKEFIKEVKKHDFVISTYSLAHRDQEQLSKIDWEGVTLDEAQNIKNPTTKQAQAVRTLSCSYRIVLTGTPIENRLTELWSIMEFLNPGYLGSLDKFKRQFAIPIERYRLEEAANNLHNLIQPFILRRVKTDKNVIKDLPEKLEMKLYCSLSQEQATLYRATVDDLLKEIETAEGIKRKGNVLALLTKLKQICNHPCLFLHEEKGVTDERSGKLQRLKDMLEEIIIAGGQALVFTQFAEMGGMLKKYLQLTFNKEVLFLYGGVQRKLRDEMIKHFQEQEEGEVPIFVLSLKAGGLGLNLTRANHVFHFDRWWNPAVENQATDRAFRIGQRRNVQVHKFICLGTFEEKIDEMLENKKGLAERIITTTTERWLTELSNEQLRDMFTLRGEILGDRG